MQRVGWSTAMGCVIVAVSEVAVCVLLARRFATADSIASAMATGAGFPAPAWNAIVCLQDFGLPFEKIHDGQLQDTSPVRRCRLISQ